MSDQTILSPTHWELSSDSDALRLHGHQLDQLAEQFGTPLHVVNEVGLVRTAAAFQNAVRTAYDGPTRVHYPFKCNAVPGVVTILREAGLGAEVMTEFELEVALHSGFSSEEIIVNGPYKSPAFLKKCLDERVRMIIVDSLTELELLRSLAEEQRGSMDILLRINPRFAPSGGNWLSGVGTRNRSSFGLDLWNGETERALQMLARQSALRFRGFHFHIGTGVRDTRDFGRALRCLPRLKQLVESSGFAIEVLDVGGGLATPTSREFTSLEMLIYQSLSRLPAFDRDPAAVSFTHYASEVARAVHENFPHDALPLLLFEPGRSITSRNQLLLLKVGCTKVRSKQETWIVCDGGLSTVSMPTYYEYHEVFPCTQPHRRRDHAVTLLGPGCFAGDIIYRNKPMPDLAVGEILAIMDSGAYFTSLESNFNIARPAIVAVSDDSVRLLRTRETFEQMAVRDETCYAATQHHYSI